MKNRVQTNAENHSEKQSNSFYCTYQILARRRSNLACCFYLGWMGLLPDGDTFLMFWENGEQFTNLTYNARVYDFVGGNKIIIQHRLPQTPDVYVI